MSTAATSSAGDPPAIAISTETIKLGQFLKLSSLVATGGEAKEAIAAGAVTVNGATVNQRGAIVSIGDVVCIEDQCVSVAGDDDDDYFDEASADDDFDPEVWRNV